MNNAKLVQDSFEGELLQQEETKREYLQKREAELAQLIQTVNEIAHSKEWSSLKTLFLDGLVLSLERELQNEASKEKPEVLKLVRTNGQLLWAKRYADLEKLVIAFRQELAGIRKILYGKPESGGK